jgi:hypothetical protein
VTVIGADPALAARTCTASDTAFALFVQCTLTAPGPIIIEVKHNIDAECLGLFHCGESRIEILAPPIMETVRLPDSMFADIPVERFYDSIVVHELAHALYDQVPCPYSSCVTTAEYLAYSFQIESLSPQDRAPILAAHPPDFTIPRDRINMMILMMAPKRFAGAAWTHLNQRNDRCAWIEGIMSGGIVFDHELP